ncbi:hypothetical protein [Xylocopilactobacillus apis]|uniref:ATP-grasp domain-containing protein n=1 Tax=Xylocopilactobacillus apis TaxID=2932183 RepID=A0AAU9D1W4_9LACO|nr:hypothetical protein [Xylocopilactobacillus apis]BDR56471.1 hypothetical protein KIMC2_10330 [Xylocopilactobacillus apis]
MRNIVLIGSIKNNNNKYSILNEFLTEIVNSLTERFDQVFLVNTDFKIINSKIKQMRFDLNPEDFQSFITDNKINFVFTLAGGKSVQSFIYQFFSDFPEERKKIRFVGTSYQSLKILTDRQETEHFLKLNQVNFPSVKLITNKNNNIRDIALTFPTRLRLISPKTRSLGLFYNFESLLEAVQDNLGEDTVLQLEESAHGDKEVEVIGLRDRYQNIRILIHNEKIDPVGVHRDHSLVIYPAVTLLRREIDEMDRIVHRIMKEINTPIIQIRFAISDLGQFRVLSIHSDLTTSELIVTKTFHLNLAKVIVELACGRTILELSRTNPNLLASDLDFFTIVGPYHEVDHSSVKSLTVASRKRANSLVMMMESNLVLGIRNTLIELGGVHQSEIDKYLTQLSDNYLVRQMMNVRIFRLFFILEAIKRDFLLEDIAEITKIDQGFLEILKCVSEVFVNKNQLLENNWQSPNYKDQNIFFPVQAEVSDQCLVRDDQIVIRFDTKKIDHYSNVYRYYLRSIIKLLVQNNKKVLLLNNSFDNFDFKDLSVIQLPMELVDFKADIDELSVISKKSFEFGVISDGSKIVCSQVIELNKNNIVQGVRNIEEFLKQISLKKDQLCMTYSFNLTDDGKVEDLTLDKSLSRAFYFSDPVILKEALSLFVNVKSGL